MSRDDRPDRGHEPERDEQLGAALRGLPVPDHQPHFWTEVSQRLAGQPSRPGATTAGMPTKASDQVIALDERQPRRPRFRLPAGAAAALVVVLAAGGVLWARNSDDGRQVQVADRPPVEEAPPAMLTATYDVEGKDAGTYRLTAASDGSFRWTSEDGNEDSAYDAAEARAVEVVQGRAAYGQPYGFVYTGVPPGRGGRLPEPVGDMADFVTALGRSGDPRVEETSAFGRPAWRYDGPLVADLLGGEGLPDRAVAEVDQATGVLLSLREMFAGEPVRGFMATSVEVSDELDRSRFQLEVPPKVKKTTESWGFRVVAPEEARELAGYDPLMPARVPDGFRLKAVAVDPDVPHAGGPEGMNPPTTHIVTMRYSDGFHAFTVTQRPKGDGEWNDPFGQEGMSYEAEPVKLPLSGRGPLEGWLVLEAPSNPHLWGFTDGLLVTVDGDLGAADLRRVAGSLRAR